MARVMRVFRTLRNHWKKSTLAACVLSYGGHWLYGKHCDNVLRREACQEAREFGRQLIGPTERLKKATIILNPAACSGKANSLFEKNSAPILHLAGVEVKVVKVRCSEAALSARTDSVRCFCVQVITGLLRRADQEVFSQTPIGFIPLGSQNSLSRSLHSVTDNKVKHITTATLSILKGETMSLDVLQIKGERELPVFALLSLRWGAFRDAAATISKYWYLGPLKTQAAHWFSSLKAWPQVHQASLSILPPMPRPPDEPLHKPPRPGLLSRIVLRLKNYWDPPVEEPVKAPEPERWQEKEVSAVELSVSTHNKNPAQWRAKDSLLVCIEPENFTMGQFITVGTQKAEDPSVRSPSSEQLEAGACRLHLPQEGAGFYNIDNEEYEATSAEVRLLPRKLRFFCSAERRAELLAQAA
uniref:Acylglycerol kinase, mitochondrial n=1 Tax=Denticeps clupeoides TaxID=299321 RepID=A0A8C4AI56_9TELE